jgi:hypothetical protein
MPIFLQSPEKRPKVIRISEQSEVGKGIDNKALNGKTHNKVTKQRQKHE